MHISKVHSQHFLKSSQSLCGSLKTRNGRASKDHMFPIVRREDGRVHQQNRDLQFVLIIPLSTLTLFFPTNSEEKKMYRKSNGAKFWNQVVISMSDIDIDHSPALLGFFYIFKSPIFLSYLGHYKNTPKEYSFKCNATAARWLLSWLLIIIMVIIGIVSILILCSSPIPHLASAVSAMFCLGNRCPHVALCRHRH